MAVGDIAAATGFFSLLPCCCCPWTVWRRLTWSTRVQGGGVGRRLIFDRLSHPRAHESEGAVRQVSDGASSVSFYSCVSKQLAEEPDVIAGAESWTEEERLAAQRVLEILGPTMRPPTHLLLQVVWARRLDPEAAADLWRKHLRAIQRLRICDVTDEEVVQAYSDGFCVRSGEDADGRPMIWVRLAFSEPAKLGPSLTVRNTWLAQDAALCGECELVRKGICFVYDLAGVGRRNVSFDLPAVALAMWGATSHPVHISRVWLLDAPKIFMAAWKAGSHLVPSYIRETVRFLSTDSLDRARCLRLICHQDQLPLYLGGDPDRFGGRFDSWIFQRLQGWELAYRPVT